MIRLLKFYQQLNILSIDVALGAVCCGAWFAKLYEVDLRPYALLSLGLTVWIIYTADHLMDAHKVKGEASTPRHRFHQRHFSILFAIICLGIFIDVVLIFFVRKQVLYAGFALSGLVLMYLLFNRWLSFLKETVVAVLYAGGVLLPVLSLKGLPSVTDPVIIGSFFITAWINVLLFAWFDHESDKRDGYTSFSVRFGKYLTERFLSGLFFMQAVLVAIIVIQQHRMEAALLLFMMNAILFLLFIRPQRFLRQEYFRVLGDAVFLIPALFLVIR